MANENSWIETDPAYWDCDCLELYIKEKAVTKSCSICGMYHEDQPDSRVNEIPKQFPNYKSKEGAQL